MTHAETSMKTKQQMAASLKRYMEVKSWSKITISAICEDCGINRKTFYYHFKDIYDLLKWTLEQDSLVVVNQFDVTVDYEKIICTLMDYVDKNRVLLAHAYSAIGKNGFERFFFTNFQRVSQEVIEKAAVKQNVQISSEYKEFLCCFYSNALCGLLVAWFLERNRFDKERFAQNIVFTLKTSVTALMQAYGKPVGL